MTQELEIEFKNLLTKEEFSDLCLYFNLSDEKFITQENHYFDTPTFSLKEKGAALRIRQKKQKNILTLKEPAEIGLLETHQPLNTEEVEIALQSSILPKSGPVIERLTYLNINIESIQYFGSLTTNRAETHYKNGLLVLDHSRYLNKEDFEVEFEVQDEKLGKKQFHSLLQMHSIPLRKTENKIKRFYLASKKNKGEL